MELCFIFVFVYHFHLFGALHGRPFSFAPLALALTPYANSQHFFVCCRYDKALQWQRQNILYRIESNIIGYCNKDRRWCTNFFYRLMQCNQHHRLCFAVDGTQLSDVGFSIPEKYISFFLGTNSGIIGGIF